MKHVMIDLETMGFVPGYQIVSIGAVEFDPRLSELRREFYQAVEVRNQFEDYGLQAALETAEWWEKQSAEARAVFDDPARVPLGVAISLFKSWLDPDALVWGNGADFDNAGLAVAAAKAGRGPLWKRYNSRCYRTVKNLAPHIRLVRTGNHHNALDDAKSQALHLMEIVRGTTLTLA